MKISSNTQLNRYIIMNNPKKFKNSLNVINLKKINKKGGYILKLIDKNSLNFNNFGELYLTKNKYLSISAWKLHKKMTCNLFVIKGKFLFAIQDNKNKDRFNRFTISDQNNVVLNILPYTWFGFQGISNGENILMNFSNLIHSDLEMKSKSLNYYNFNWKKK